MFSASLFFFLPLFILFSKKLNPRKNDCKTAVRVCVCVCVCQRKTKDRADGMREKSAHCPGRDVCACHNEKKVPDEWQARQATPAILQVSKQQQAQHKENYKSKLKGPVSCMCVCVCVCVCVYMCVTAGVKMPSSIGSQLNPRHVSAFGPHHQDAECEPMESRPLNVKAMPSTLACGCQLGKITLHWIECECVRVYVCHRFLLNSPSFQK